MGSEKKVYLVGAGPGDPDLLTIKAWKILKAADVILYDRLVSREMFRGLPKRPLKVYTGRRKESAGERQDRIYHLILKYHAKGKRVVRLKNGDPMVFGRGGEEIDFLRRHGIEYEVVPGITSAIGVPSEVGLPLTHREVSSSVLIVPGHTMRGKTTDWVRTAGFPGTIVILMGAGNIAAICKALIKGGKDRKTPSCMIVKGTLKGERTICGTLDRLAALAIERRVEAPVVTVIGEAVRFAQFYHE